VICDMYKSGLGEICCIYLYYSIVVILIFELDLGLFSSESVFEFYNLLIHTS